ncbi:MAG: carboxypeptidase-like regulatory domain-containing protein, partial [Bacteroidetes bacterium]
MTFLRTLFSVCLLLVFSVALGQEKTKVKGTITDAQTGEPLPFVNVSFVGKAVGTTTDFNGKYQMDTKWGSDKIQASFMGYEVMEKSVVQGQNNTIDFALQPKQIKLEEVVIQGKGRYRNKENPAVALIQKVVDHRDQNRKEGFDHYQFDKYEKLQIDLNNITEKFMERKMFKKFEFMWQYVDTSEVNGKPYLPLYFTETKSKVYLRKTPQDKKEVVYGMKTVGFEDFMDEEGIDYFMEKIYQDIDIYDNTILLMEKQFKSPISNIAP